MPALDLSYIDPSTGAEFNGYLPDSKADMFIEQYRGEGYLIVQLHVPVTVEESKTDVALEFLSKHQFVA